MEPGSPALQADSLPPEPPGKNKDKGSWELDPLTEVAPHGLNCHRFLRPKASNRSTATADVAEGGQEGN